MMEKKYLNELEIECKNNIISLAVIGSYDSEYWMENRSDIDILVLANKKENIEFEFDIEDYLTPKLQAFFSYEDIHITFLYMNEFDSDFAKCYINSKNKLIIDIYKEIDFRLYVNKYIRNNEWLDNIIKEDTKLLKGEN